MYSHNDIPFYIGKGFGSRYKPERHLNSKHYALENKLKKIGLENVQVEFLHTGITEENALQLEKFYIWVLGRRNRNRGTLLNLTDGGEGSSGHIQSEETKKKRSISMKKAVVEGRTFTKEHRAKIGIGRKGIPMKQNVKEALRIANQNCIGSKHHRAKLSEKDVLEIISRRNNGESGRALAKHFHVSESSISMIFHKKNWSYMYKDKGNKNE